MGLILRGLVGGLVAYAKAERMTGTQLEPRISRIAPHRSLVLSIFFCHLGTFFSRNNSNFAKDYFTGSQPLACQRPDQGFKDSFFIVIQLHICTLVVKNKDSGQSVTLHK